MTEFIMSTFCLKKTEDREDMAGKSRTILFRTMFESKPITNQAKPLVGIFGDTKCEDPTRVDAPFIFYISYC